jgi:GH15 family glucan-1,4-alpha-glucosidase
VREGETIPFVLTAFRSHLAPPAAIDPHQMLETTERWWQAWSEQCTYQGPWREAVIRSLVTLKALIHQPTGGIVAAPTTSLPEALGGSRNWDYRYTWIRDASFTLYALLISGHQAEARAWREWLLRAVAGSPEQLQALYGVAGERRLVEYEISHLPGYAGSRPVRVGNDASNQLQLDVYGELMDAFHVARRHDVAPLADAWSLQRHLLDFLESHWELPDESIWEIRGSSRHFTYSKVMAWVAMDRAVQAHQRFGLDGEVDRWRALRETIRTDVLRNGYDEERGSFVQYYGGRTLDASLLLIPLVGFLPATDPRVTGTVQAILRELLHDGLVLRYDTNAGVDGLEGGEGAFLACSFWMADNLAMSGRRDEALALFERLLSLRNDVGLLAEEYDPVAKRLVGNFPQAFSHVALINTAWNLEGQRAHRTD